MELGTEPTFSIMGTSSVRQGTQDSDEPWLRYYLADNTPTPAPKKKDAIKSQSKESDEDSLVSPERFKVWKEVKGAIEHWCQPRRILLREGNLPPVSQSQPELDSLIDSWNEVFV
jgi:hypothetical protein